MSELRVTESDIVTALVEVLTDAGFYVMADEINEGFPRPAVFVSVLPTVVSRRLMGLEEITEAVTIEYVPDVPEGRWQCMAAAEVMKSALMYSGGLTVCDRVFTIGELNFSVESIGENELGNRSFYMTCDFELSLQQAMPTEEEDFDDTIETLELDM